MHAIRAYGNVYVRFHPFLFLTLDSSRQFHISAAGTHLIGRWVDIRSCPASFEKRQISSLCRESKHDFWSSRSQAQVVTSKTRTRHSKCSDSTVFTVSCNSAIIFLSKMQTCLLTSLPNMPAVTLNSSLTWKKGHSGRRRRHKHGGARRVTTSVLTSASWSLVRNPYVIIMVVGRNKSA